MGLWGRIVPRLLITAVDVASVWSRPADKGTGNRDRFVAQDKCETLSPVEQLCQHSRRWHPLDNLKQAVWKKSAFVKFFTSLSKEENYHK